jgi:uncharacterized protein YyaL (SSP411 family)
MTGNYDLEKKAHQIGDAFAQQINSVPQGYAQFLSAMLFADGPSFEVVIVGETDSSDTQKMIQALQQGYYPNLVILLNPSNVPDSPITEIAPWLKDQKMVSGIATAYVCQDFTCKSPTNDIQEMVNSLGS